LLQGAGVSADPNGSRSLRTGESRAMRRSAGAWARRPRFEPRRT
jgi:hypothetical protein